LTAAAADGVRCARVRLEINFLLIFETAPFFCKHPVLVIWKVWSVISKNYYMVVTASIPVNRIVRRLEKNTSRMLGCGAWWSYGDVVEICVSY
jgi:hypothetical protein